MTETVIKAGIEMPKELHKRMKALANERDKKLREVVIEAFEAYISTGTSIAGGKQDTRNNVMELPLSKIDAKWQNGLALVLKDGTPEEQATLKGLLEFYLGQIRKRSASGII